jgi:HPt (histidine-containing phosphotransfer) domain-containing protein
METSAESYLSNVVNGSVTMMAEACGQARRRYRPVSPPSGEKPFKFKGFEVKMPAIPAASRSSPPGAAAGDAAPASVAGEPPIDLVHLERQTDGDPALQQELLALFDKQLVSLLAQSSDRAAERRRRADAAHQLKGSALAVGAGAVAGAAAAVEAALAGGVTGPEAVESALAALAAAVEAARAALAALRG